MSWLANFFGDVDSTAPRNLEDEMGDIRKPTKGYLNLGRTNDAAYGRDQLQLMDAFMSQAVDRYPELASLERTATSDQRSQDASDLRTSGRSMQKTIEGMAPELKTAGNALLEMLRGVGETSPLLKDLNAEARGDGMSPINQRLQDVALRELDLGGDLSPDERRRVIQDSRAGYSARGMLGSDGSTIDEVMNLGGARRAREMERIGLAGDINTRLLGEEMQDRNFGLGVEGLNQQRLQSARAFIPAAIGAGNARLAPMLSLFGGRTNVSPMMSASMMGTAPNPTGASARTIADVLGYGGDLFNTNFNAEIARKLAETDNAVALHKSMDSTIASMAGGMMGGGGMCWVARAVYGAENPRWLEFRAWLLTKAPAWFRAFYAARGPKWAARIANDPDERAALRATFDEILSH
jgi:hypothetical protein